MSGPIVEMVHGSASHQDSDEAADRCRCRGHDEQCAPYDAVFESVFEVAVVGSVHGRLESGGRSIR